MYKFSCEDRQYQNYKFINAKILSGEGIDIDIDPIKNKLFNQDIFEINEDGETVNILHSTIRSSENIPGVIILKNNKTYGKKKDRHYYKCIPDDKRLPVFLIPYKIKHGFSKNIVNKYVVFKCVNWDNKHPHGVLVNTLGDVNMINHFYEYQLYCKSLYASIQNFNKAAMDACKKRTEEEYIEMIKDKYNIEDRTKDIVFSVDPLTSKDFDDAFSQKYDIDNDVYVLSVYISNVPLWMEAMNLWQSFSDRIATIYLPDRKRPMLPTILSDNICSLIEKRPRFAFTMDLIIHYTTFEILNVEFKNCLINVNKNLRYDTKEQSEYKPYKSMKIITRALNQKYKYMDKIATSHDVVAYLMVLMNNYCAKEMIKHKDGIYRSVKLNDTYIPDERLDPDIKKFLKIWNSFGGKYCKFKDMEGHDIMDLDAYIHITSPIRRLPDLLTMMILQDKLSLLDYSEGSKKFHDLWMSDEKIEYINTTMRSIRKVQNDCELLNMCINNKEKYIDREYVGFVFDKIKRNDGLFQYMVYIAELKMVKRFTTRYDIENSTFNTCKLYIFNDEERFKHKIMVEIIKTD